MKVFLFFLAMEYFWEGERIEEGHEDVLSGCDVGKDQGKRERVISPCIMIIIMSLSLSSPVKEERVDVVEVARWMREGAAARAIVIAVGVSR